MQMVNRLGIFLDLCIVTPSATNAAMTSQVLTNLVFLVRRKDQPLDKSVFIRKEKKPSSYLSTLPWPLLALFLPETCIPILEHPPSILVGFFDRSGGGLKFEDFTPIRHPDD